jgi:hypothetical protein
MLALLLAVTLTALLASGPARAQDDEPEEDDGRVHLMAQIEIWAAQPAGLDFTPATRINPDNPFDTQLHTFDWESEAAARYRAGFELPGNYGAVILTWFAQRQESTLAASSPGQFVFGETMAHPLYAGFSNDGLADAYSADAAAVLRDFRIDYYRTAFESSKVSAKWFVGWRRVQHKRNIWVEYPALAAPIPPLIPPFVSQPRDDLQPGADYVEEYSYWEGRGINAGMDFTMPLFENKFSLIGGFDIAALRGKVDTSYSSSTYYYAYNGEVLSPPYEELDDPNLVSGVTQEVSEIGLRSQSRSTSSGIIEGYIGAQWDATRWLNVQLGFRSSYYNNVGVELRPKVVTSEGGLNVQDVSETDYSVTYEGFFLAAGFRF